VRWDEQGKVSQSTRSCDAARVGHSSGARRRGKFGCERGRVQTEGGLEFAEDDMSLRAWCRASSDLRGDVMVCLEVL